jgi:hypothetical protein
VLSVTMPDTQNGQAVAIGEKLGELTATTVMNGCPRRMRYACCDDAALRAVVTAGFTE